MLNMNPRICVLAAIVAVLSLSLTVGADTTLLLNKTVPPPASIAVEVAELCVQRKWPVPRSVRIVSAQRQIDQRRRRDGVHARAARGVRREIRSTGVDAQSCGRPADLFDSLQKGRQRIVGITRPELDVRGDFAKVGQVSNLCWPPSNWQ